MSVDTDEIAAAFRVILSRHLDGQEIGPDDDFYAMGGDSLTALRVVADANAQGIDVTLRDVLYHSTPRTLAVYLAAKDDDAVEDRPAGGGLTAADRALLPSGLAGALPASALQVAMIYLCDSSAVPGLYHSEFSWEVGEPFDEPRFRRALAALCERHAALRSSFDLGTYSVPAQLFHRSVETPLTVGSAPDRDTALDWGSAPLFRCGVEPAARSFRVTLRVHHALVDGWGYGRLIVDLLALYQESPLPGLPLGVEQAFLDAEHAQLADPAAAEYWRAQAGEPLLFPGSARFTGAADARESVEFPLSDPLIASLRNTAKELRVPLKSLAVAAHAQALAVLTGHSETTTGLVVSTRPQTEGSDLVAGLYLNTVPVRVRARGSWPDRAVAALVAERNARRYAAYPLAHIERELGHPAFEATFNFTHFHLYRDLDALDGLDVRDWRVRGKPSFPFRVDFELEGLEAGSRVVVAYDPERLPGAQAKRYADLFEQALGEAAAA
ncbi:condensation domain-containing protein [Streptomyces sp. NPDC005727]|uniref:condensation domain-containing protein n=1 Tax=Streptomyces sp. NPDC005727 TaxID=3157053 RepID=UPI00340FC0B0